jgi:hypothetical protein
LPSGRKPIPISRSTSRPKRNMQSWQRQVISN